MDKIANEVNHGKKIAHHAEDVWGWSTPGGQKRAKRRAEYLIHYGILTKGTRVLEIGCGTGVFTEQLAETGASITAIDISPDLLKNAESKNLAGDVSFKVADAEQLSFPDNSFDVVLGSSILHHLDTSKVLPEAYRVLSHNGRFIFAEPNMLNPQIFLERNVPYLRKVMHNTPDETAFVRWRLAKEMRSYGFMNVDIFPYDFLHPFVPGPMVSGVEKVGKWVERIPLLKEIAGSLIIFGKKA